MLTEIYSPAFDHESDAKRALTLMRRKYGIALRGAVACPSNYAQSSVRCYRVHVPLDGTGFSASEFSSALWPMAHEVAKKRDSEVSK